MSASVDTTSSLDFSPAPALTKEISICELDRELGTRRGRLLKLIAERDFEQNHLAATRAELERLTAKVCALEAEVTGKNQAVFVLLPRVERLLELREKIQRRAVQVAQEHAAPLASPDHALPQAVAAHQQRVATRAALAVEVSMHSETNFYVGFSENVSEGGLFVATYETLPVGEAFPVTFALPGRKDPIKCLVEVAWVREYKDDQDPMHGSPGMGLRFVGLDAEDQSTIAEFVERREPLFFPEHDELS